MKSSTGSDACSICKRGKVGGLCRECDVAGTLRWPTGYVRWLPGDPKPWEKAQPAEGEAP